MAEPRAARARPRAPPDDRRRRGGGRRLPRHRLAGAQRRPRRQRRRRWTRSSGPSRKTGYVVNQHARSLVTQRSQSVAFMLTEPQERLFEDPNFNVLLRGCTQALAEHDITLLLTIAGTPERPRAGRPLPHRRPRRRRAAGLDPRRQPAARGAASAAACRSSPAACRSGYERRSAYVAADDRDGARQMVELPASTRAAAGSPRSPARWTPPAASSGSPATATCSATATDERWSCTATTPGPAARRRCERLLRPAPDLDAVFVASDLMAAGALTVLRARRPAGARRTSPSAASTTRRIAASTHPALTTIRQPLRADQRGDGPAAAQPHRRREPAAVIVPTELVVRNST